MDDPYTADCFLFFQWYMYIYMWHNRLTLDLNNLDVSLHVSNTIFKHDITELKTRKHSWTKNFKQGINIIISIQSLNIWIPLWLHKVHHSQAFSGLNKSTHLHVITSRNWLKKICQALILYMIRSLLINKQKPHFLRAPGL